MRVLIFAPYFWPHKGGVEKYVEETAVRLQKIGHKIDIVTALLPNYKVQEVYRGISIYRIPTCDALGGRFPIPRRFKKKLAEIAQNKYSAIITHTRFFPLSAVGTWFARKYKLPQLHIEHGTEHPPAKPYICIWLYDHIIGAWIMRKATVVAGISQASQKFVNHLHKRKTILLPNAIDTNFFSVVPKKKLFDEQVVTFVGRLIEAKGVQVLLAATKYMTGVKVLIVGAGNYEQTLKELAGENVTFLGEKSHDEIREILSYTDVFVNPSYAEGLPTSILEAGALGVPVIATNVGGTREIIVTGKTGFLIQPKSIVQLKKKLQELLRSPKRAQSMGHLLQKTVKEKFDWKMTAEKLAQVLVDLNAASNAVRVRHDGKRN